MCIEHPRHQRSGNLESLGRLHLLPLILSTSNNQPCRENTRHNDQLLHSIISFHIVFSLFVIAFQSFSITNSAFVFYNLFHIRLAKNFSGSHIHMISQLQ